MIKGFFRLLPLLLLTACVLPQARPVQEHVAPVAQAGIESAPAQAVADLRRAATELPGAEVGEGEPLTIRYPGEALFSVGAALPLAGGTEVLDPLAAFLTGYPATRWQGTVRAHSGVSADYDQQLGQKRAELLGRYFSRRGIGADRLSLTAESGDGPVFELVQRD